MVDVTAHFNARGVSFQHNCGQTKSYQKGTPDAFDGKSTDGINEIYVNGFWKTVTLGLSILLAQLIATLIQYPFTVPLQGLTDWSAFLERVFLTM